MTVGDPESVRERDLIGGLGQRVAALGLALAVDDPGVLQLSENVLEELERDSLGFAISSRLTGGDCAAASSTAALTA